jgi:hypothetical protein
MNEEPATRPLRREHQDIELTPRNQTKEERIGNFFKLKSWFSSINF